MKRALLLFTLCTFSAFADEIGPEIPVTESTAPQRNAAISRDSSRTLVAFEETAPGAPTKVVLHQYEASFPFQTGRETFALPVSANHQLRPELGPGMVAWMEEALDGSSASLWQQPLGGFVAGSNFSPAGPPERLDAAMPGTRFAITHRHVFHVLVWTAPDGRLKAIERSLVARIGYDPSPWYATNEKAINPATPELVWNSNTPLVAYNYEAGPGSYGIRALAIAGRAPSPTVDIAPPGASAPRVVYSGGSSFVVFWSMDDGATYAQEVNVLFGVPALMGPRVKVADGVLHDATLTRDMDLYAVVDQGMRYALVRLNGDLDVEETTAFQARVAEGEKISVSSNNWVLPMLAYVSPTGPRAVLRAVDDGASATAKRKRRSSR
jgi:hypothetical protein